MTKNHFRSYFSPFQINTQLLFFFEICRKMAAGGHFGWPKITFDRISHHFRSIRNFFFIFFSMSASGHFGSRFVPKSIGTSLYSRSVATSNMKLIGAFLMKLWSAQVFSSYFHKIDRVLPLYVINGCVKYEFDTCIGVAVTWNTSLGVRRWRLRRRLDQNHNIPEVWNFGDIIMQTFVNWICN